MEHKGTMVGTEDYIAPEVIQEEPQGVGTDLWSFGVILFMMLSGKSPFKGSSQFNTLTNITQLNYEFPADGSISEEA